MALAASTQSAPLRVAVKDPVDFAAWRDIARALVQRKIGPDAVFWSGSADEAGLFGTDLDLVPAAPPDGPEVRASRKFLAVARDAICHRDPERFDRLYRVLWRLQREPGAMGDSGDPGVRKIAELARQVRRDIHKMRALVRFREVAGDDGQPRFVAWFEPEHQIMRANARFFVDRFASMRWTILTPQGSLDWDGSTLREGPPVDRAAAPGEDGVEALWQEYYQSTFNPARLKTHAMLREMPRKYWRNLPEAPLISGLVATARQRELAMIDASPAMPEPAERPGSLTQIAREIEQCRRCPIGCNSTRAVAGEGPRHAGLAIVGEQPGDSEEQESRPFVGPAGQVLDGHLEEAGIDRAQAWVTNAVKHFKFTARGKRRLHQSPTAGEIDTCRWWLDAELDLVKPRLILALGASAARGLLGRTPSVQKERGRVIASAQGMPLLITTHPSYLLRLEGPARAEAERAFARDLQTVSEVLRTS